MTDEEMAEEYTAKNGFGSDCNNLTSYDANKEIEQAFLAGLKAGRPQWHDLRKTPDDLPKEDKYYLIVTKLNNYYISRFRGTCWIGKCNAYVSEDMVIAWCEIPTFDKE